VNHVHFYLHLELHDVADDEGGAKHVLKDGSEGTWLRVSLVKDTARIVVAFSEVDDLADVLIHLCGVGVPDTLATLGDLLLYLEKNIMLAALLSVSSTLSYFGEALLDKKRGNIFVIYFNAHSFLGSCHVLSHIVDFAANDFLTNQLSGIIGQRFLIPVRVTNARHVDVR